MNKLKMFWTTHTGQLVCRWVDAEERIENPKQGRAVCPIFGMQPRFPSRVRKYGLAQRVHQPNINAGVIGRSGRVNYDDGSRNNATISGNYIFIYPLVLLLAWIGTWLINLQLRTHQSWNLAIDTAFWILMKLVIWIAPVLLVIHFVERAPLSRSLDLRNTRQGLLWGGFAGLVLTGTNWVIAILSSGTRFHTPALSLILVNAVVIAPIVEEIALRGFLLNDLQRRGVPFWFANVFVSTTFVLLHLPGWYFAGNRFSLPGLNRPILYLAVFGVLLGWLKRKSRSLYAPLLAHALNNIYSSLWTSP